MKTLMLIDSNGRTRKVKVSTIRLLIVLFISLILITVTLMGKLKEFHDYNAYLYEDNSQLAVKLVESNAKLKSMQENYNELEIKFDQLVLQYEDLAKEGE